VWVGKSMWTDGGYVWTWDFVWVWDLGIMFDNVYVTLRVRYYENYMDNLW